MKIIDRWQRRCCVALSLLLLAAAAQAQTNPLQKGPDPTSTILNANAGPFAIASTSVPSSVSGFGGGTVYYPTTAGSYATVAICPGFTATQSSIAWIGQRLASHGFVAMTINTNSTFDQPPSRTLRCSKLELYESVDHRYVAGHFRERNFPTQSSQTRRRQRTWIAFLEQKA